MSNLPPSASTRSRRFVRPAPDDDFTASKPGTVVVDLHRQVAVVRRQGDLRVVGAGVLGHVRQGLADHEVCCTLDIFGESSGA